MSDKNDIAYISAVVLKRIKYMLCVNFCQQFRKKRLSDQPGNIIDDFFGRDGRSVAFDDFAVFVD